MESELQAKTWHALDRDAKVQKISELRPRIYAYCRRFLSGRPALEDAAEDVTQKVFVKAIRYVDSFTGDGDLYYWACAIARNLCKEVLTSQKNSRQISILPADDDEGRAVVELVPDTNVDVERQGTRSTIESQLFETLHRHGRAWKPPWDELDKRIAELRLTSDKSMNQIAIELKRPYMTVTGRYEKRILPVFNIAFEEIYQSDR